MPLIDQDPVRPLADIPLGGRADAASTTLPDVIPAGSSGNVLAAVIAGLVAAAISAGIWAGITIAIDIQIGWMAIGVGFLCGVAVRAVGKGNTVPFRVIGAACSLLGIVFGNAFAIVHYVGHEGGSIGVVEAIPWVFKTASPVSYLFYAIGLWQGWKVAVPSGG